MFYTLQISINSISQHVCRFSVCIRFTGILYPFLWITVTDITLNPLLFMKIQWQLCIFYCYALIYRNIKTNSFNVKRITKHVFKVISPMSKLVLWCTGTSLISWFLVVIFIQHTIPSTQKYQSLNSLVWSKKSLLCIWKRLHFIYATIALNETYGI